ncbi:hypothetical protein DK45_4198 [Bordetella bronchiseptica]|nr:hypothetical protein DK45_4198 [Bordetella bronchiseptica]
MSAGPRMLCSVASMMLAWPPCAARTRPTPGASPPSTPPRTLRRLPASETVIGSIPAPPATVTPSSSSVPPRRTTAGMPPSVASMVEPASVSARPAPLTRTPMAGLLIGFLCSTEMWMSLSVGGAVSPNSSGSSSRLMPTPSSKTAMSVLSRWSNSPSCPASCACGAPATGGCGACAAAGASRAMPASARAAASACRRHAERGICKEDGH